MDRLQLLRLMFIDVIMTLLLTLSTDAQHIYTQLDHGMSVCLSVSLSLCLLVFCLHDPHSGLQTATHQCDRQTDEETDIHTDRQTDRRHTPH